MHLFLFKPAQIFIFSILFCIRMAEILLEFEAYLHLICSTLEICHHIEGKIQIQEEFASPLR